MIPTPQQSHDHHSTGATTPPAFVHTLEQLTHNSEITLDKKAKRKAYTRIFGAKMIQLKSPHLKAYQRLFYCSDTLIQTGTDLKTSYCKNRFCAVCNAIKTANLINGYLPELEKLKDVWFLTLTVRAVTAKHLRPEIKKMIKNFRSINQHLNKYEGIKIKAIRKLEMNYNYKYRTFNPHFHLIIEGYANARALQLAWLDKYESYLSPRAQDLRRATPGSMRELFKYATKIVSKDGQIYPKAMDTIYGALQNIRIVQPYGIKKVVDEDAREAQTYPHLTEQSAQWDWVDMHQNWFNIDTGEPLTRNVPEWDIHRLGEQIKELCKIDYEEKENNVREMKFLRQQQQQTDELNE